jgi:hypothetical protein
MCEVDGLNSPVEIVPANAQPDGAPDQSEEAKNPVDRISDDAGAVDADTLATWQSNSGTTINAYYETIARKTQLARGSSFDALKVNMEIGGLLYEVKPLIAMATLIAK